MGSHEVPRGLMGRHGTSWAAMGSYGTPRRFVACHGFPWGSTTALWGSVASCCIPWHPTTRQYIAWLPMDVVLLCTVAPHGNLYPMVLHETPYHVIRHASHMACHARHGTPFPDMAPHSTLYGKPYLLMASHPTYLRVFCALFHDCLKMCSLCMFNTCPLCPSDRRYKFKMGACR